MSAELQNVLTDIIKALAEWTGQTVDTVTKNLPMFLAKYGWYTTLSELPWNIIWTFLGIGVIVIVGGLMVCGILISSDIMNDDNANKMFKTICTFAIWIWICSSIIFSCAPLLTTAIAPEIVGLKALMELIKSVG